MSDLEVGELWTKINNDVDTVTTGELEPNAKRKNKNGVPIILE